MSIRDLRTFLAIAEGGSFAAAARTVHRTQSAVTVQMRALEEELGTTLFDRSRRPPLLNPTGRALVERARDVVEAYDRLFSEQVATPVEGQLKLGVVPSVITGVLPPALAALQARYPGLHVEVAVGLSRDLLERLGRGALDAAVLSDLLEGGAGLSWSPFAREQLVVLAPPDAPARRAEDLLATYPFIRYTRQAWVGQIIDRLLRRRRIKVQEVMTLDTLEAIAAMVHHGLGVSIVPFRTGGFSLALPVQTIALRGPPVHRTLGLVHAPNHPKAALAELLLEALTEQVRGAEERPQTRKRKAK